MKEDFDKRIGVPDEVIFRSETRSKILEILFVKLGGKKENIGAADEIMSLIESELDKKYLHEDMNEAYLAGFAQHEQCGHLGTPTKWLDHYTHNKKKNHERQNASQA